MGTPTERAARDRLRASVDEWLEQQQQQRATWEVCAFVAEAANCDLDARPSKANEDRRAAESELAAVRWDKERRASRVKTLERDLATARKATGGRPPGQTGDGADGPTGERAREGAQSRRRSLPFGRLAGMACPG